MQPQRMVGILVAPHCGMRCGRRHPGRLCNKSDCANDRHAHAGRAVRTRRRLVAPESRCVRGAGDRQAV